MLPLYLHCLSCSFPTSQSFLHLTLRLMRPCFFLNSDYHYLGNIFFKCMINIEYSFTILTAHDTISAHNATRQLISYVTNVTFYEITSSLKTESTPLIVEVSNKK
jgi:hypothetical protein